MGLDFINETKVKVSVKKETRGYWSTNEVLWNEQLKEIKEDV